MSPDLVLRFYAWLLSLFPPRFRDEFGAEMQSVFAQVLEDADARTEVGYWSLMVRELRDLALLALREYRLERSRPRYKPATDSTPTRPRLSRRTVWACLSLFIGPALVTLLNGVLPEPIIQLLIAILGFGWLAVASYGLRHGLPSWMAPHLGSAAGVIGVVAFQMLRRGALGSSSTIPADVSVGSLFIQVSWLWLVTSLALITILFIPALLPGSRPLWRKLYADWTQIAFICYGAAAPVIVFGIVGHGFTGLHMTGAFVALGLGAWGYLRAGSRTARLACLLTGVTLAFAISGMGNFSLLPLGDGATSPVSLSAGRRLAVLTAITAWLWSAIALISPWLVRRRPPFAANLALMALWLYFFRPIYPYLQTIFTRQEFRLNQLALAGVIGLMLYQARRGCLRFHIGAPPAFHPPALALLLGSSSGFLLAERLLDINTLSAGLFGLALYGLLGLWLDPSHWRQGLPAALLLIATLPFGEHLQTFIGYPVRLLTALLVREGLAILGFHSIGIDTILVFENGISQVDLPCSGVKSLWTGGIFMLAATWIERRRFHQSWMLVGIVFAFLLIIANLARVAVLVTVGQALGWRLLAEMLHVPLGVLGFAAACAALVWMLRRFVPAVDAARDLALSGAHLREMNQPRWLAPALFVSVLGLALLYTPRAEVAAAQSGSPFAFAADLNTEPWRFSPGELYWLSSDGPLSAGRWRFDWQGHTGSLLVITSNTWRAHHRPERCFESYGLTVNQSYSRLLEPDFPLRVVLLSAPGQRHRYSAVYWLQAPGRVTDDYATRIWSDLSPGNQTWSLVTVLFDAPIEPLDSELAGLYTELRRTVDAGLNGNGGIEP